MTRVRTFLVFARTQITDPTSREWLDVGFAMNWWADPPAQMSLALSCPNVSPTGAEHHLGHILPNFDDMILRPSPSG
jgi:hypothetical protein